MNRKLYVWFLVFLLIAGCFSSLAACRRHPAEESEPESAESEESLVSGKESEAPSEPESQEESESSEEPEPVWDGEPFEVEGSAELGSFPLDGRTLTLGLAWSGTAVRTEDYPDPVTFAVRLTANGANVWRGEVTLQYPGSDAAMAGALVRDVRTAEENGAPYLMLLLSGQEGERLFFLDARGKLTGQQLTAATPLRSFEADGAVLGNELTDDGARVLFCGPAGLSVLRAYPFDGCGQTVLQPLAFYSAQEVIVTGAPLSFPADQFRSFAPGENPQTEDYRLLPGSGTAAEEFCRFTDIGGYVDEQGFRIDFRKAPIDGGIRLQVLTNGTLRTEFSLCGEFEDSGTGRLDQLKELAVRRHPEENYAYIAMYFLSDTGNLLCLMDFEGNWCYVFRSDVRMLDSFLNLSAGALLQLEDVVTEDALSLLLLNEEDGALVRLSIDVSAKGVPLLEAAELIAPENYRAPEGFDFEPGGKSFDVFELVAPNQMLTASVETEDGPRECVIYSDGSAYLEGTELVRVSRDCHEPIQLIRKLGDDVIALMLHDPYMGTQLFLLSASGEILNQVRSDCSDVLFFSLRESGAGLRDYVTEQGLYFYLADPEQGSLIRCLATADGQIRPMQYFEAGEIVFGGEAAARPEDILLTTSHVTASGEPVWSQLYYVQEYEMNGRSHRLDLRFAKTENRTGTYLRVEFYRNLVKVAETVLTETELHQPDRYYVERAMRSLRVVTAGGRDYLMLLRQEGANSSVSFLDDDWNAVSVFPLDFGPTAPALINLGGEAIGEIHEELSAEGTVIFRGFVNSGETVRTVLRLSVCPDDGGKVLILRPLNYCRGQLEYSY